MGFSSFLGSSVRARSLSRPALMVLNKHQAQVARGELIVIQADAQQDYDFFFNLGELNHVSSIH